MHKTLLPGPVPGPSLPRHRPLLGAAADRAQHALRGLTGSAVRRWQTNARAKRDRIALLAMPDHAFRDFGVSRYEVLYPIVQERSSRRNRC